MKPVNNMASDVLVETSCELENSQLVYDSDDFFEIRETSKRKGRKP